MNKTYIYCFIISLLSLSVAFTSCDDWVEVEPKFSEKTDGSIFDEDYYASLREYKESDHPVTFGWFGNWTAKGASLEKSLAGLPDSVDFVSIWGNWRNLSEEQKADLKFFQEVKGSKALMCFIVQDLGSGIHSDATRFEFWGWKSDDRDSQVAAIRKYANAICDTIDVYGYDGFDIDYEPNYGHRGDLAGNLENMTIFIEELGKRIGPKSGTNRMLVVDGEPQSIPKETGEYFDYFIVQAYNSPGDSDLDNRLNRTISNFSGVLTPEQVANKYIVTENFEDHALKGGVNYTDRNGKKMLSLEGMARWTPIINGKPVRKGGIGTYHMEYEFVVSGHEGTYPFLRNGTRIMNPPVK